MYSRRNFLKIGIPGSLMIGAINPIGIFLDSFKDDDKMPDWKELLDFARWCPSVHNMQPHRLKLISNNECELYYDPSRLLPVGDPNSIFATVALGIFIENLSIAASPYGKKVEIVQLYEPISIKSTRTTLFATLKIVDLREKEILDRKLILKRRTSRVQYDGKKLENGVLQEIEIETKKHGYDFFSTSEESLIEQIISLNQSTLFRDLEYKPDREELDGLFRYSKEEAEEKKDGLWSRCMGFSGALMKSVFQNNEFWNEGVRKRMLSKHYKSTFEGTKTIGWFGGRFDNTTDWLQAGKMLARNWLILTKGGAYMQPFGSLITNNSAYEQINQTFKQPNNGKIWMIFRAGYSKEPTASYRLDLNQLIIE